jgi:hypothetical protein
MKKQTISNTRTGSMVETTKKEPSKLNTYKKTEEKEKVCVFERQIKNRRK